MSSIHWIGYCFWHFNDHLAEYFVNHLPHFCEIWPQLWPTLPAVEHQFFTERGEGRIKQLIQKSLTKAAADNLAAWEVANLP
jgi:hypothetical protein